MVSSVSVSDRARSTPSNNTIAPKILIATSVGAKKTVMNYY